MFEVFSRSWEITKESFNVIKKDKELIWFPILAGIFSIIFIFSMLFPFIFSMILGGFGVRGASPLFYLLVFLTYFGLAFIATFFNFCVVYTAKKRFSGGNATFSESIKFAFSKIKLIFLWSILAATVGLLLRILDGVAERLGKGGEIILKIVNSILGMIWSIVTIFVVPVMVYQNLGPIDAIKKSFETLKKTWGESIVRYVGFGLVELLFIIIGIVVAIPLFIILAILGVPGILLWLIIVLIYFIGLILIFNIATTIFNTALFEYAETGKVVGEYKKETMQSAFKKKEAKK
jgi:hypothetical protein